MDKNIWKDNCISFRLLLNEYIWVFIWFEVFLDSQLLSLIICFLTLWGDWFSELTCNKSHWSEWSGTQRQCYFHQTDTFLQKSYKWNHFRILFTTIRSYLSFIVQSLKHVFFSKKKQNIWGQSPHRCLLLPSYFVLLNAFVNEFIRNPLKYS